MDEQGRTRANTAEHRRQLELPTAAVEASDEAYLAAAEEIRLSKGLPDGAFAIVRRFIEHGRRDGQAKRLPYCPQRQLAAAVGVSLSTVCEALKRLTHSGLIVRADGDYRLDLGLLVAVADEAQSRRDAERIDPAEALDRLLVRPRSGAFGCARAAPDTVEERSTTTETETVPNRARAPQNTPNKPNTTERDGVLEHHPAWVALQTRHFRNEAGRPRPDLRALRECFDAAVDAGLFYGPAEAETDSVVLECKTRFLATAYDLAANGAIRSPAVILRVRTERRWCYRISEPGRQWAKRVLRPKDLAGPGRVAADSEDFR